jgi:hypothetical protein
MGTSFYRSIQNCECAPAHQPFLTGLCITVPSTILKRCNPVMLAATSRLCDLSKWCKPAGWMYPCCFACQESVRQSEVLHSDGYITILSKSASQARWQVVAVKATCVQNKLPSTCRLAVPRSLRCTDAGPPGRALITMIDRAPDQHS